MTSMGPLNWFALVCAAAAAMVIVWYLVRRPPLSSATKLWLLLGLGPLPTAAALAGNVSNYEVSKERRFCASCHVMAPYVRDVSNRQSKSLAAAHSHNPWFGNESCYVCHADYAMFGTVTTKLSGMGHMWAFYSKDWSAARGRRPHLYKPFSNAACVQCHAREAPNFTRRLEHAVHAQAFARSEVGCISSGCHGPAHAVRRDPPRTAARGEEGVR